MLEEAVTTEVMMGYNPEKGLFLPDSELSPVGSIDAMDQPDPLALDAREQAIVDSWKASEAEKVVTSYGSVEEIVSAETAEELKIATGMKEDEGSGLVLPEQYLTKSGVITKTANFLRNSRAGRAATAFIIATSVGGVYSLANPDKVQADTTVCTASPGGDSTTCTTTPDNPPSGGGNGDQGNKPDKPHHGGNHHHDGNLLPLPKHHTNRYWSTMILNEIRQGHKGTISASKAAQHSLYQTRKGECTPVEMVPGACVKLDKTLLETLYKASQIMRFRIDYTVSGNHVTCSDHYQGRGADLMRYNDDPPHNRRLLHILDHQLHKIPGHHTAQLLGPGDPGHSGSNAHWHIGITGSNNICE